MIKKYTGIIFFVIAIVFSSCYTIMRHPEVIVSYEDEQGTEQYSEDYDVYVDEDCQSCHQAFNVAYHFNPLLPAHIAQQNRWSSEPWWFDNKYVFLFGDGESGAEEGGAYEYQHVVPRGDASRFSETPTTKAYLPARAGNATGAARSVDNTGSGESKPDNNHGVKASSKDKSSRKSNSSRRVVKKRN